MSHDDCQAANTRCRAVEELEFYLELIKDDIVEMNRDVYFAFQRPTGCYGAVSSDIGMHRHKLEMILNRNEPPKREKGVSYLDGYLGFSTLRVSDVLCRSFKAGKDARNC